MGILHCEKEATSEILEGTIIESSGRRCYSLLSSFRRRVQQHLLPSRFTYLKVAYSSRGNHQYFLLVNADQGKMDFKGLDKFVLVDLILYPVKVKCYWTWPIHDIESCTRYHSMCVTIFWTLSQFLKVSNRSQICNTDWRARVPYSSGKKAIFYSYCI